MWWKSTKHAAYAERREDKVVVRFIPEINLRPGDRVEQFEVVMEDGEAKLVKNFVEVARAPWWIRWWTITKAKVKGVDGTGLQVDVKYR